MNKNAEDQNAEQLYMTITLILNEAQCHRFLSLAKGKYFRWHYYSWKRYCKQCNLNILE